MLESLSFARPRKDSELGLHNFCVLVLRARGARAAKCGALPAFLLPAYRSGCQALRSSMGSPNHLRRTHPTSENFTHLIIAK